MKHLSEEELIAQYYGEAAESDNGVPHLRACRECAARFAELKRDLEGIRPAPAPDRNDSYGDQVWQALRPSLVPYERRSRSWLFGFQWKAAGLVAACALLMAAAFVGGRYWERRGSNVATHGGSVAPQSSQRVVLVVLTDHLDRTERLLVALDHADPGDAAENSELQSQARELLASNRLYRVSASEAGDPALAGALDRLERVLAEVANDPNLSAADLERVRKEMNTEGILFEIRVLLSQTPGPVRDAKQAKGVSL